MDELQVQLGVGRSVDTALAPWQAHVRKVRHSISI